tara:strand:- start:223 stop:348 length:126 start_codon:yes stop_codon:yes gene_type:complete
MSSSIEKYFIVYLLLNINSMENSENRGKNKKAGRKEKKPAF